MIIQVKVYPHSGREEIVKESDNSYKVYLKKPAKDNKANLELIKLLKEYFLKDIKIIKGLKSRSKIVELR